MNFPNISGVWRSELGKLSYIVTQLNDFFVWQTIHKNGILETGCGRFLKPDTDDQLLKLTARWNFHNGRSDQGIKDCDGHIIRDGELRDGMVAKIHWTDHDHFVDRLYQYEVD